MDFASQFRVRPGRNIKLSRISPEQTGGMKNKEWAEDELEKSLRRLDDLQCLLYAENKHALLIVLQAMDAAGKDGTIRNVLRGINPQGCTVTSFKKPSEEELDHDFLWRIHQAVPNRGDIGIFNRSHYEDVLVVRVQELVPKAVWSERYAQINAFEKLLAANGVAIVKIFLHISKEEQLKRFRERLADKNKRWKFSPGDLEVRKRWGEYMRAYEDVFARCSTPWAPWHIIPANYKWYRNLAVSRILVDTLERLDMKFPKPAFDFSKLKVE